MGLAALSRHLPAVWRGPLSVTCHGPLRTGGLCPHRYWHRSLNPRKLIEVKFSHLSRNMTMQRTMKLYRLPEASGAPGSGQERREGGREAGRAWQGLGQEQGALLPEKQPSSQFPDSQPFPFCPCLICSEGFILVGLCFPEPAPGLSSLPSVGRLREHLVCNQPKGSTVERGIHLLYCSPSQDQCKRATVSVATSAESGGGWVTEPARGAEISRLHPPAQILLLKDWAASVSWFSTLGLGLPCQ